MSTSPSTLSFQSPLSRMRGGFRDALVLALVAATTAPMTINGPMKPL